MASITIDIPDADVDRALAAFCTAHGYTGANTRVAKAAFAKAKIAEFIKTIIVTQEARDAAAAAKTAAEASAQGISVT